MRNYSPPYLVPPGLPSRPNFDFQPWSVMQAVAAGKTIPGDINGYTGMPKESINNLFRRIPSALGVSTMIGAFERSVDLGIIDPPTLDSGEVSYAPKLKSDDTVLLQLICSGVIGPRNLASELDATEEEIKSRTTKLRHSFATKKRPVRNELGLVVEATRRGCGLRFAPRDSVTGVFGGYARAGILYTSSEIRHLGIVAAGVTPKTAELMNQVTDNRFARDIKNVQAKSGSDTIDEAINKSRRNGWLPSEKLYAECKSYRIVEPHPDIDGDKLIF